MRAKIKLYQVDAFANELFTGNPAAVCILQNTWLPDNLMQKIALENNLSETAFVLYTDNQWNIRWFTPAVEVNLCGHATLAAAHVMFNLENYNENIIHFNSRSGILTVTNNGNTLSLNFPTDVPSEAPAALHESVCHCFNIKPLEVLKGKSDAMAVFSSETDITTVKVDLLKVEQTKIRGLIITAPGTNVDFVSRFFAPQSGIIEDPVTGSAHTILTPYWSKRLNKTELTAMQLSARKGWLTCKNLGERTEITGKAITYLVGEIEV